jgi:hypothetical protein
MEAAKPMGSFRDLQVKLRLISLVMKPLRGFKIPIYVSATIVYRLQR